jgi:hypothetical protein
MPYLYCTDCAKKHRERFAAKTKESWEGEAALVVKGKLTSGPWLCDSCNKGLNRGRDSAYLVQYLSPGATTDLQYYDFAYERRYFKPSVKNVELFGWDREDFLHDWTENIKAAEYAEEEDEDE